MVLLPELNELIEEKMDPHLNWEEHWGKKTQTILDIRVVDLQRLVHEWEYFYSEMNYWHPKYCLWVYV